MNDRIQAEPSRPDRPADQGEYYAANFRKPQGSVPGWVWVLVALPILGIGVLFCGGMAAGFLMAFRAGKSPPPAVSPAPLAPALPADPLPDEK